MNIQLLIFLLFAIASAAIIFFLESSNHEPLELRSTSPLTKGNIQPVLEEFGAKQIRIHDNLIQFEYENTSYLLGTAILPMIRLYACWYLDDSDDIELAKRVANEMHLNATGFGFHAQDDRRIIVSVSSFETKKDGLLDSLPYMIVYLRDAVLSFIQEFEKAKSK